MASAFMLPGTKRRPGARWFARFRDAAGVWRARRVRVEKRADALAIARKLEAMAERVRYGLEPAAPPLMMQELLERFVAQLSNRSWKDDESRIRLHVAPKWSAFRVDQVSVGAIVTWLDDLKAQAALAPGSQRHLLGLLSRAFAWGIARGLCERNPARDVPSSVRPSAMPVRRDADDWLEDEQLARRLMAALPSPFDLGFYLGHASGLRLGEAFGLRLGDLDDLEAGSIRVAHSFDGVLKEDRKSTGKSKLAPAPADAAEVLGPWLAKRRAEGAGPDSLLFPGPGGRPFPRYTIAYAWRRARQQVGISLSWHAATRRSACSRWASRGIPLDVIASAVGHASTATTAKSYQKWRRKTFPPALTASFAAAPVADVIAIGSGRAGVSTTATAEPATGASIIPAKTGGAHG
jgi:integrase